MEPGGASLSDQATLSGGCCCGSSAELQTDMTASRCARGYSELDARPEERQSAIIKETFVHQLPVQSLSSG